MNKTITIDQNLITKIDDYQLGTKKNFSHVMHGMKDLSASLINRISQEQERNRFQAALHADRIMDGFSTTNYNLLRVVSGITDVDNRVRESADVIASKIDKSADRIIDQFTEINAGLRQSNWILERIATSMQTIEFKLGELIELISKPNEVQAIERANEARINIAIGNFDEALRNTRLGMELCSTSITVTSYHLMTLSLFREGDNKADIEQEIQETFNNYVKLIDVLLKEHDSENETIRLEILNLVFPTIFAVNMEIDEKIFALTEELLAVLKNGGSISDRVLERPLFHPATEEQLKTASLLAELIWTTILKERILEKADKSLALTFLKKLTDHDVLVKNELVFKTCRYLATSGILTEILTKHWCNQSLTNEEELAIELFTSCDWTNELNLSETGLAALELSNSTLMMLYEYVFTSSVHATEQVRDVLDAFGKNVSEIIQTNYIVPFAKHAEELKTCEASYLLAASDKKEHSLKKKQTLENDANAKIRQWKSERSSITQNASRNESLIRTLEQELSDLPDGEWTTVIFALITGFTLAALMNSDDFGFGNFIAGIVMTFLPGQWVGLAAQFLVDQIVSATKDDKRTQINNRSASNKELAEKDKYLETLINEKETELAQQIAKLNSEFVHEAKEQIVDLLSKSIRDLEKRYEDLLDKFYPPNDVSRTHLNSKVSTPGKLGLSSGFINNLSNLIEPFCVGVYSEDEMRSILFTTGALPGAPTVLDTKEDRS